MKYLINDLNSSIEFYDKENVNSVYLLTLEFNLNIIFLKPLSLLPKMLP